jgi:hypothetical protein
MISCCYFVCHGRKITRGNLFEIIVAHTKITGHCTGRNGSTKKTYNNEYKGTKIETGSLHRKIIKFVAVFGLHDLKYPGDTQVIYPDFEVEQAIRGSCL